MAAARGYDFNLLPGEPFLFLRASDDLFPWAVRQLARRMSAEIDMGMRGSIWHEMVDRWRALATKADAWRGANPAAVAAAAAGVKPVPSEEAVLDEVGRLGLDEAVPARGFGVAHVLHLHAPHMSPADIEAFREKWALANGKRAAFLPTFVSIFPEPPERWWVRLVRLARAFNRRMTEAGEWLLS